MQYLFHARTPETQQLWKEIYWKSYFVGGASAKFYFVIELLWDIFLICSLLVLSFYARFVPYFDTYHLVGIGGWVVVLFNQYRNATRASREARKIMEYWDKKLGNAPRYSEIFVFEDHLRYHASVSREILVLDYADLFCVKQTKHYILIVTQSRRVYAMDKRAVEGGSADAAFAFLQSVTAKSA